jgi:hypothetical protein
MRNAHHCDSYADLLDVARTHNDQFREPMDDGEVIGCTLKAWEKTQRGENWFGRGGIIPIPLAAMDRLLILDDAAISLFMRLLRHNNDHQTFCVANSMAARLEWTLPKFKAARRLLLEAELLRLIHPGGRHRHDPSVYAWGVLREQGGKG